MSELITLQTCFLIVGNVLAQDPRVYTESDGKGGVKIMAEKKKAGNSNCRSEFYRTERFRLSGGNPLVQTINSAVSNIGSLARQSNGFSFSYRHSYKFYPGKNMLKANTLFPYLMPVKASNPVITFGSYYIGEIAGKKSSNYYAIGLNFLVDDTVFATRACTITVASGAETERGDHELYNVKARGNIGIEHEEGILAKYNFTHPIKTLIEPGDFVVPGQAIAVYSGSQNSNTLLFSVSYLDL